MDGIGEWPPAKHTWLLQAFLQSILPLDDDQALEVQILFASHTNCIRKPATHLSKGFDRVFPPLSANRCSKLVKELSSPC